MELRWTAKGNTAVNIIAWLTAIAALLIAVVWFGLNNPFYQLEVSERLDEDVWQLSNRMSRACTVSRYYGEYNPLVESGTAEFRPGEFCLTFVGKGTSKDGDGIRRCAKTPCKLQGTATLDLSKLENIVIDTNANEIISYN